LRIENEFVLDLAVDRAFELLTDLDAVAPCLSGARLGQSHSDGSRDIGVDVRFGPMAFRYAGTVRLTDVDGSGHTAVLHADVKESAGEGAATAAITMSVSKLDGDRSQVGLSSQVELTGRAAQLGNGLIEDLSEEMLEDFARAVARVNGPAAETAHTTGSPARPGAPGSTRGRDETRGVPVPNERSISAMKLLLRVLRRRLRRAKAAGRRRLSGGAYRQGAAGRAKGRRADLDLVVVGTGSGALAAAIVAYDAGLRVAIYEKAAVVGGGTAYSGGVVWAPCNHIMRRKEIADSIEDACEYLRESSGGRGDEALQRRYVETVGSVIEQLEQWTGISWVIWTGQPDYYAELPGARLNGRAILPHPSSASDVLLPAEAELPGLALVRPTPHMDFVPGFQTSDRPARYAWLAGRSIIGGLWKAVLERGIEYHLSTPVAGLLRSGGDVVGIRVESEGATENVTAGAVLLNTGGFDWNESWSRRYLPGPIAHPQTPPSNTGDGHVMAMGAGAGTALMDKAVWHPSIQIPGDTHDEGNTLYRMFNLELSKPHCVVVNKNGRRFATEAAYYALSEAWMQVNALNRTYPNVPSYFICDATYREKYGLPGVGNEEETPGWITARPSLEELALALDIDPVPFAEEIATFNRDAETGEDSRFARGATAYERYWGDPTFDGPNPTMGPLEIAPFYAFQVHPSHAGTRGGVTISPQGRVLATDGAPITGLYACGNTAANLLFGAGYASGSAVGSSLVFGYLAAVDVIERSGGRVASTKPAPMDSSA
jgi:succinate dehydrogenase/fumarate reductase flavoprotein subunit/carbon monoxide dehydrogenase subunit G